MDVQDTGAWFDEYLRAFTACCRGESDDIPAVARYFGVPLLMSTDEAAVALTTEEEVAGTLRRQVEGLRAAAYDRSETIRSETVALNATSALHTAEYVRRRTGGGEIGRLRATYLITAGPRGRRISALAVRAL